MEDTSGSEESGGAAPPDPTKKPKKGSGKRRLKTFSFGKWQKGFHKAAAGDKSPGGGKSVGGSGKKRTFSLSKEDKWQSCSSVVSEASVESVTCICTGYRRTKATQAAEKAAAPVAECSGGGCEGEDASSQSRRSNYCTQQGEAGATGGGVLVPSHPPAISINEMSIGELTLALQEHMRIQPASLLFQYNLNTHPAHTQVDYVHHLVPDLRGITHCGFYWGKMDRYVAERTLDKRPEGTFLLRDSAQEEFLFSVSFRRYGRTLHARIEQLHPRRFSFDAHDPSVFTAPTVRQLVEHYKNPSCCMFFEPMLTLPVHRTQPFDLQHLCRAVVADCTTYDGVNHLRLPKRLKAYLKEYHYRQRVRVRHLEDTSPSPYA